MIFTCPHSEMLSLGICPQPPAIHLHEINTLFKQGQTKPGVTCRAAWRIAEGEQSCEGLQEGWESSSSGWTRNGWCNFSTGRITCQLRLGLGQPEQTWIFLCAQVPTCKLKIPAWYTAFANASCVNTEPREALITAYEVSQPVQWHQSLFLHIKDGGCVHIWDYAPKAAQRISKSIPSLVTAT